jgi:glutathione S-transferase
MRLHDYAASGNCLKVRLLLGLARPLVERVPVDIFAGDTLTGAFGRLNPLRETPVLELDPGDVITQSGAILWYLAEGTPYLPPAPLDRARVVQWLAFEQERIMSPLGGARFRLLTGRADPGLDARLSTGRAALDVLAAHLSNTPYVVAGTPTIADLALYPYISVAADAGADPADWPPVTAWLDRLRALPRFADDLVPYPENARPGRSRSIYDDPAPSPVGAGGG